MKLTYAPRALDDLVQIEGYIAESNPENAVRFIEKLLECCDNLAKMPGMGRMREDLAKDLHGFVRDGYIIFYRVKPNSRTLEIVRIIEGSRDYVEHWEE